MLVRTGTLMTGDRVLRDADKLLAPAVERTLRELELGTVDDAVATLAQSYAAAIDDDTDGEALGELGPKLLAALQALQATPAARAKVKPRGGGDAGQNRLQALREARR
jgi:hypothetical protein